jgi:non-canonical (house-cleaning) NTP pyrophosphatase
MQASFGCAADTRRIRNGRISQRQLNSDGTNLLQPAGDAGLPAGTLARIAVALRATFQCVAWIGAEAGKSIAELHCQSNNATA